jgi:hypothetical protein
MMERSPSAVTRPFRDWPLRCFVETCPAEAGAEGAASQAGLLTHQS